MRVMVLVRATPQSEAGVLPSEALLTAMGDYNEELVQAGIMLAGEGLHPSGDGARVTISGDERTVTEGPFAEVDELVAGFWLWQVDSLEEAIEWAKRCPAATDEDRVLELRPIFEPETVDDEYAPEARAQEELLRAQTLGSQPISPDRPTEW